MIKRLKTSRRVICFGGVLIFVFLILVLPSLAQSQNPLSNQDPLAQLNRAVEGTLLAERSDLPVLIIEWITRTLQLVSLVLVILLIAGGLMWMSSG